MRKTAIAVALLLSLPAVAQNIGPLPPLTARVEVKVVNVDVSVTDSAGRPVTNLTKDDFEIFEDGKPQKVANFYVIEKAGVKGSEQPVSATTPVMADPFRRKFVLLVDNNYIDKIQRDMALAEIDKFVDASFKGEHEWAIAAISQRLEMIHPFTSDKKEIHAAIDRIRNSGAFPEQHEMDRGVLNDSLRRMEVSDPDFEGLIPTVDYAQVVRFQAREQTYRALRAIRVTSAAVREMTHAYGASEGKKVLILLTGGMEINTNFAVYEPKLPDREIVEAKRLIGVALDDVVSEANAANFTIHIINARRRGMIAPQHEVMNKFAGTDPHSDYYGKVGGPVDTTDTDSTSMTVAVGTGGTYSRNEVDRSLAAVEDLSSNFYALGYSPRTEDDRQYHSIKVRVKRPGVRVAHRRGYLDLSAEDRLERFLQARFSADEKLGTLPVKITVGHGAPRDNETRVPVQTSLPMDRLTVVPIDGEYVGRVHVYISVFDADGRNIAFNHQLQEVRLSPKQFEEISNSNFRYTANVHLNKGAFKVVITLRDELSNEIGSATEGLTL